ncbi:MAG TPA: right-handed parallel beta-helix repeat-containing protein, partial [Fimbriimonadaceae bacterium]|nr:right-handed parallel beta-helix repeat-containing protein [Fimbriimonadaceae bacterium]
GVATGKPFYFENVVEELDSPGEYYIDRKKDELLFWPSSNEGDAYLSWSDKYLLRIVGGTDVTVEGLHFETSRTTPVEVAGGTGNTLRSCVFRNLGQYGVKVSGGTYDRIVQCRFLDMGAGGVELYGGDRKTLTPANDVVEDCLFERFSRLSRTYRPGVSVNGVGMTVSHCEFRDAPHSAIFFNGNDHLFVGNVFRNVVNSTGDAGAIYAGRDWTKRGTVIRDNLFDNINGLHLYENGVYLDDQLSGITIEHNAFVNCWLGMMVGGGRDNFVHENLFVRCHIAMHLDARGLGWAKGGFDGLKASLESVPYKSDVWKNRYPGIERILDDDPMAPKGNIVAGNALLGAGKDTDSMEAAFHRDSQVEGNFSESGDWDVSVRGNTLVLGPRAKAQLPPALQRLDGTKYGPRFSIPDP